MVNVVPAPPAILIGAKLVQSNHLSYKYKNYIERTPEEQGDIRRCRRRKMWVKERKWDLL